MCCRHRTKTVGLEQRIKRFPPEQFVSACAVVAADVIRHTPADRLLIDPTAGNSVADRCGEKLLSYPLLTETLSHFHAYCYFRSTYFESADLSLQLVFKGPTHADMPNKLRTSLLATALAIECGKQLRSGRFMRNYLSCQGHGHGPDLPRRFLDCPYDRAKF